jgi:hypothetical protein
MDKLSTYRAFLQENGYRPDVRDDFLAFVHEGGNYVITADTDPQYFQILYPYLWSIDSPAERQRALEVAGQTTAMMKAAKVYVMQRPATPGRPASDDVSATIELFLPKVDDFAPVFRRALRALQSAAQEFATGMQRAAAQEQNGSLDGLRRSLGEGGSGPARG